MLGTVSFRSAPYSRPSPTNHRICHSNTSLAGSIKSLLLNQCNFHSISIPSCLLAMSAAASPKSHTANSQSSPRYVAHSSSNPTGPVPIDERSRHRSTVNRTSSSHRRSNSRSYPNDPPPAYNETVSAGVARRDYETTNLARSPSSRRSSSRDRNHEGRPHHHRTESGRSHHRTSSRHASGRNSVDMSGPQTVVANGGSTPVQPSPRADRMPSSSNPASGRRRTTITAQTGQWALGKTIGQGSMGKVKLAKNMETGEQVRTHPLV